MLLVSLRQFSFLSKFFTVAAATCILYQYCQQEIKKEKKKWLS